MKNLPKRTPNFIDRDLNLNYITSSRTNRMKGGSFKLKSPQGEQKIFK